MKLSRFVFLPDRGKCIEKGLDRAHVLAAYLGEPGIWKGGIEVLAVATDAVVHRLVEILFRPIADAGRRIGSNVGGVDNAKRRRYSESARIRLAALIGMTRCTIAGIDEVASSLDGRVSGALSACRTGNQERWIKQPRDPTRKFQCTHDVVPSP